MKVKLASYLKDDIASGDITSALIPEKICKAEIVCNQACVLSGLEEAGYIFSSRKLAFTKKSKDGKKAKKGDVVAEITGLNKKILEAERTALNILGRMSGVATACAKAKKILGKKCLPALTRKTSPGFNLFDKKAAETAGIFPHRANLSEMVLLKENHLYFFPSPSEAVLLAKKKYFDEKPVEVEAESLEEALSAAEQQPLVIMLDNFSPKNAKKTIAKLKKVFSGKIELSGGINFKNLKDYADAGANFISMGCLTTNVASIDFSLRIKKVIE